MPPDPFLDQLVDWRDFELFVRDLYAEDSNLIVEHDVTLRGKSDALRQIDVLFRHKAGGHTYLTLVECKRWKEPISRDRVDVLVAAIKDLNASKGVLFTTSGFEAGAEALAKSEGVELFIVRDLTDEEWGRPGRVVWFYLQYYTGQFVNLQPIRARIMPLPGRPVPTVNLQIRFGPGETTDPAMTLYSFDGEAGPNITDIFREVHHRVLDLISKQIGLINDGTDGAGLRYMVPIRVSFDPKGPCGLHSESGLVELQVLETELEVAVKQTRFEFDRGNAFDLAVAVEHYMTREKRVVTRRTSTEMLESFDLLDTDSGERPPHSDELVNGTVIRIILEPYVMPEEFDVPIHRTGGVAFALPDWTASSFVPDDS
jgi:hypothetical protein